MIQTLKAGFAPVFSVFFVSWLSCCQENNHRKHPFTNRNIRREKLYFPVYFYP